MSKITWADYEPRRSGRQTSRPVRYVVDDDDVDGEEDIRVKPADGKTPRPRRIVQSSDEDDHDGESSDISVEPDENDSEEMNDSSDDFKIRKKKAFAPVGRPTRRKMSYAESSDEDEDENDDDDDIENDENDEEEDGENDLSSKSRRSRPDNIEALFEEPLEPAIEKIVGSKNDSNDVKMYEVKWKGRAYIHNSWHHESELMDYKGFRILINFIKHEQANKEMSEHISDEQLEQMNVAQEMALQKRKAYMIPERILTTRMASDGVTNEYLVKWTDLPYDCCTWEKVEDLGSSQFLIDSYLERTRSSGKSFAKSHGSSKGVFRKFEAQPEWMAGSGSLRDYQLEGLNWLRFSHFEKRNVILADEMGLGKTIQCISLLGSLHADLGIPGPYLIVVPLSTISAWKREFAKWAPWMNVIEYRGNVQARAVCRQYEWGSGSKPLFNVLLINYEVANKDYQYLSQYTWSYQLVDEAHRLKDDQSLLYQTLKSIRSSHRLLITGTPLQNSVKELWCLLHFLDPQRFKDLEEFQSLYGEISESTASVRGLSRLHDLLKPYLLRRTKGDVLKSLPSKTERILRIDMSDMQKRYYRWVLTKNFHELNKGLKGGSMSSLSNTIVELKKVSNHPYLFDNAELNHHENVQQELSRMVSNSGKMVLLDRLLDRLFETGHRVLIFSQMVRMLDILADYMVLKGFKFQRLDGGMSSEDRQHAMDHFNAEGSADFVFLLSTRAGGLGVNLATADTVIIFDSDWNPQNDLQAEARAHRIGQTKTVNIYRFVTKGTVEEDILERAKRKMILDHLVIQKMDTSGRGALSSHKPGNKTQFDKAELMRIVEFGAKQLFDESEDTNLGDNPNSTAAATAAASFDLDEILARAETTTDRVEVDQTDEFLSAFKFADFVSSAPNQEMIVKTNAPQAAAEDGSFWEKVIPAHLRPAKNSDMQESADLIYPRRAKMGKIFEPTEGDTNNEVMRAPVRRRNLKTKTYQKSSSKGKGDASREIKLAVKAIMQFGDDPKTTSAFPGDNARNTQLIRRIIDECNAGQKDSVTIDGIDIDAASLKGRIEDLATLKKRVEAVDSPYDRFRVTAHIQSVRWKCSWGVRHDSMLLLGAYLYGVGAWSDILNDKRLGLGEVVVKPNSDERIVGNSQLSSRLQALLRAIRSQDQKIRSTPSRPMKRKSPDSEPSPSERSAKVYLPKSPVKVKDISQDDSKISNWCLATMKESKPVVKTLKKLKSIHRADGLCSDPKNVVKYIFKVGDFITRTGNEDRCNFATPQQIEHHLWKLSAPFVKSTPERLSALYWDLAAEPNATGKQESILRRFDEDIRNR